MTDILRTVLARLDIEHEEPCTHSKPDLRVGISRSKSVHPGEAELAGTVYAPIGGLLFAFDDREGRVDIADVVAVCDAVEMKEHGVEPGAQDQAAPFVPDEGWCCVEREAMSAWTGPGRSARSSPERAAGGMAPSR